MKVGVVVTPRTEGNEGFCIGLNELVSKPISLPWAGLQLTLDATGAMLGDGFTLATCVFTL